MPQLVQGHVRFTEDDFAMSDFTERTEEKYRTSTYLDLVELLNDERLILQLMRDGEILELFNTDPNIKKSLANALAIITALAQKSGFKLADLLRSKL